MSSVQNFMLDYMLSKLLEITTKKPKGFLELHERPNSNVDEKEDGCAHNRRGVMVHFGDYG